MSSPSPVSEMDIREQGPRENKIKCVVTRDECTSTYRLYLDSTSPAIGGDHPEGELLLAARRFPCYIGAEFIICSDADNLSKQSSTCVGKLRRKGFIFPYNFTVFDTQNPHDDAISDATDSRWWRSVDIGYHFEDGPRDDEPIRSQCTLHNIPASAVVPNDAAPTTTEFPTSTFTVENSTSRWRCIPTSKSKPTVRDLDLTTTELLTKPGPLVLKSKAPWFDDELGCWRLNVEEGRTIMPSCTNFQMIAATGSSRAAAKSTGELAGGSQVLLQCVKIGDNRFTMDYGYPLSAFQAFANCLSKLDLSYGKRHLF